MAVLNHKVAAVAIAIVAFVLPISGTQAVRAASIPTSVLAPPPQWATDTPDTQRGLTVTTADFAGNSYGVSANGLVRRYDPTGTVAASWMAASGAVQIHAISVDRSLEVSVLGRPHLLPVVMGSGAQSKTVAGPFVARFTAGGDLKWVRSLTTTNPFALAAQSASAIGESGSVFVSGQYQYLSIDGLSLPTATSIDGFVLRLDATTGRATWLTAMTVQARPFRTGAIFVQSLRATAGHVVVSGITGYNTVVGAGSTSRTIPCAGTSSPGSCAYLADFDPATGQPIGAFRVATDGSVTQTAVADGYGYTVTAGFTSAITVGAGVVNTGAVVALPAPPGGVSGFVAHMIRVRLF